MRATRLAAILVTLAGLLAAPVLPGCASLAEPADTGACCCPLCACQETDPSAGLRDGARCPCSVDDGPSWPSGPALPVSEAAATAPAPSTTLALLPGSIAEPGVRTGQDSACGEAALSYRRGPSLTSLCRHLC